MCSWHRLLQPGDRTRPMPNYPMTAPPHHKPMLQPFTADPAQPCSSSTAASAAALPQPDHSYAANPAAAQPQLCRGFGRGSATALPQLRPQLYRSSTTALPQILPQLSHSFAVAAALSRLFRSSTSTACGHRSPGCNNRQQNDIHNPSRILVNRRKTTFEHAQFSDNIMSFASTQTLPA